MYVNISEGIETKGGSRTMHVLKILNNIYEQRQGSWMWNQHLNKRLEEIVSRQSLVDDCMFYRGEVIFIIYVENAIFASPSDIVIDQAIT